MAGTKSKIRDDGLSAIRCAGGLSELLIRQLSLVRPDGGGCQVTRLGQVRHQASGPEEMSQEPMGTRRMACRNGTISAKPLDGSVFPPRCRHMRLTCRLAEPEQTLAMANGDRWLCEEGHPRAHIQNLEP